MKKVVEGHSIQGSVQEIRDFSKLWYSGIARSVCLEKS